VSKAGFHGRVFSQISSVVIPESEITNSWATDKPECKHFGKSSLWQNYAEDNN
jgi:hypothetical protein